VRFKQSVLDKCFLILTPTHAGWPDTDDGSKTLL